MPDTNYQDFVLDIIYSIASQSPIALEPYLKLFDSQIYYESFKIEKIISTVGKSIKKHSEYCTELLVKRIKYLMNKHKREVEDMEKQRRQQRRYSLIHQQQHQQQQFEYLMMEERQQEDGDEADAEEDSMNTSHNVSSFDYSASHRNNGRRVRTSASFQYSERLSSSNAATSVAAAAATIANSRRVLNRRFVQLLTEIYEIAHVFPYVLNPHLTELEHLFRKYAAYSTTTTPTTTILTTPTTSTSCNNNNNNDKSSGNETTAGETLPTATTTTAQSETSYESIAYLIERLRELQRENSPKMSSREEDLDDLSSTNNEEASLSGGDRLLLDNSGKEEEEINTVSSSSISRSTSNQEKRSSELRGEGGGGATTTTTTDTTTVIRPNYNQQQKDEETINSYITSRHQTHEQEENIEVEEEEDGSNQQLRREGVEEDYELIALANNLAIKEPELARPDDDDEYDEAAVVPQNLAGQEQEDRFDSCPPPPNVNLSASLFNHDLNRQIEQSRHPISSTMRIPPSYTQPQIELNSLRTSSLMYSDRGDVVERFCTKHGDKIRNYVRELTRTLPIPDLNLDEMIIPNPDVLNKSYTAQHNTISFCKRLKSPKPTFTLKFSCSRKQANCCLFDKNYFEVQTAHPAVWIHLIFLATQAKMNRALNQTDKELIQLKLVYEKLSEKLPFVALVTSSFPQDKQISELVKELKESRLFDLFEYKPSSCCDHNLNSNNLTSETTCSDWQCYLCANPERALDLSEENAARPLIQGQLKEKHGKWKFLRRWHKRVFTLTGSNIVYFKKDMRQESLNVRYIRSIQPIPSSKADKNVPKVFEIFTNRNSFLLKAQNSRDAAQWLQFLQLTKALQNSRNATENNNNNPNNNSNYYYYNHTANNLNNSIVNTTTNVVNDNQ